MNDYDELDEFDEEYAVHDDPELEPPDCSYCDAPGGDHGDCQYCGGPACVCGCWECDWCGEPGMTRLRNHENSGCDECGHPFSCHRCTKEPQ